MHNARAARLLFQLPMSCRVYAKIQPASQWGWSDQFANRTNYLLEMLVWQNATPTKKGERAAHQRKKPKPFIPPFLRGKQHNEEVHTVDEIKQILAQPRG